MMQVIHVEPLGQGWAVREGQAGQPRLFSSGAQAEDAALFLGRQIAAGGHPAEIRIYLRGGAFGGRHVCPAQV